VKSGANVNGANVNGVTAMAGTAGTAMAMGCPIAKTAGLTTRGAIEMTER
jgi:hypothetical protein